MSKSTPLNPQDEFVFLPLGGSGEIGMNLNLYGYGPEDDRRWIIVDIGVTFGDDRTPVQLARAFQVTKGAITKEMVASMAPRPIIFAMANPDPEITPEDVLSVRSDAIMATGRSDYPNQVNNVLGFPYIFRGALDVRASTINEPMKIAAAEALAALAREDVPDELDAASAAGGKRLKYGADYILPLPFDPRLISRVPAAVAKAAMDSGVARKPISDLRRYARDLTAKLDPTGATLDAILEAVRANPRRVVFAEGEEEKTIRAATAYRNAGYGTPILIGREERVLDTLRALGINGSEGIEVHNARLSGANRKYADFLYARLQRRGFLFRDCQRLVNQDRNVFAACMVACGDADAMVTGLSRSYAVSLEGVRLAIDPAPGHLVFAVSLLLTSQGTVLVGDTAIHERPDASELAAIAKATAAAARRMGREPRVAFLSFSTFGDPKGSIPESIREAVALLDQRPQDFEYDGEMAADVALNANIMQQYPFCRLSGPANVLVMPDFHSASISTKMLQELGGSTVIGPLLVGLNKPVQIVSLNAKDSDIVNMAAIAAYNAGA